MPKVILHINSFLIGSTGNIMKGIASAADEMGYKSFIAYPSSITNNKVLVENPVKIGFRLDRNLHLVRSYISGYNGCYSVYVTNLFISRIKQINPDIIHLHNLHNCYINLEIMFDFLRNSGIPIVWTLHDCWSFTGQCTHYSMINCEKWKKQCYNCPQFTEYPSSRVDKTEIMYQLKRKWFTNIKGMYLVTPSLWLKNEVKQSFLCNYPINVINNGIDLTIFKPTKSDFRLDNNLLDKTILLGVANPWSYKKGLQIFKDLSKKLDDNFVIVLVGLTSDQIAELPEKMIGIRKTDNQNELAKIYTASDYFLNPSFEETMGLVTIEALACGTPVIVSNLTAVPEVVTNKCGIVVNQNTAECFYQTILTLKNQFLKEDCISQAREFNSVTKYSEYTSLYTQITSING